VLIPRPETEELVEHVLATHGGDARGALRLLDVGCGSGAIGLALLSRLTTSSCVAIDVSDAAVDLARLNAEHCGFAGRYAVRLAEGGIAQLATDPASLDRDIDAPPLGGSFDIIVSNPPYIPRVDMLTLEPEVAVHEDEGALCGGDDGLDVVRDLLRAAPRLLRRDGPRTIWLEVDASHPPIIQRWVADEAQSGLALEMVRWLRDMGGLPRFCELRWSPGGSVP
jgi:release factor glutamine methyltransferase